MFVGSFSFGEQAPEDGTSVINLFEI